MGREYKDVETALSDCEFHDHLQSMGLTNVDEYRRWCVSNGFSDKLKKPWRLRCRERFEFKQNIANQRIALKKREKRHPVALIEAVLTGKLKSESIIQPHLKRLCKTVEDHHANKPQFSADKKSILKLYSHLHAVRAKCLDGSPALARLGDAPGNSYVEAMVAIAHYAHRWIRPVDEWTPKSHSPARQFASLLRHLFVRFDDMPAFFNSVWFAAEIPKTKLQREWYLQVGQGVNIRKLDLPIVLTKKMSHYFMRAPSDSSVEQALRWAQVIGLGGADELARALMGTRLGRTFEHDDFWISVIRWFIEQPTVNRATVGPMVDYLHNQRFVDSEPGLAPPQPGLSMRGRTPGSLMRQMENWHQQLARQKVYNSTHWKPSGIAEFQFLEGTEVSNDVRLWLIRELLCTKELMAEGRTLKHCVATYNHACLSGVCSIWTMEVDTSKEQRKVITIEVRMETRQIVQARGRMNRLPNDKEWNIIRRWAATSGLGIAGNLR